MGMMMAGRVIVGIEQDGHTSAFVRGLASGAAAAAAAAGNPHTSVSSCVLTSADLVLGDCGPQASMEELASRGDTGMVLPGPAASQ